MSVGQFYTVNVDNREPYHIYGGLQDNGTLAGSSRSVPNRTENWDAIYGGDGMFVAPDPRDPDLVYTGFQFGNYARIHRGTGDRLRLRPRHDIGEDVPRYNWRTPLKLSKHNADIVYMASQRMYRSMDQGENWAPISPDLTHDLPQGNVPFSTITTFSESPLEFGFMYAGTDDGRIWVTRGSGADWTEIGQGLPSDKWVSSVFASPHDQETVFVSLNGYREDDFNTYVYRSNDAGKNWTSLNGNLPDMVVNDLIQDAVNPDLLYLGGDLGLYISMDGGESWNYTSRIPNVAVYDLIVHPRDQELVVATHGRSMYVLDVKPLQAIAKGEDKLYITGTDQVRYSERWGEKRYEYTQPYEPRAAYLIYADSPGEAVLHVLDDEGHSLQMVDMNLQRGFNRLNWDLLVMESSDKKGRKKEQKYISKGEYTVRIVQNDNSAETSLKVR